MGRSTRAWWACLLAALVAVPGCGPSEPKTYPAFGKVVFRDGRPVTTGVIEFSPADGGPSARARIGADGRFVLTTGDRPGAVAGRHRIGVLSMIITDGVPTSHGRSTHLKGLTVHPKYARLESSGLERIVEPDRDNEFTIEVDAAN
jgi:hypothetical protein